jgi:hypothetical protein
MRVTTTREIFEQHAPCPRGNVARCRMCGLVLISTEIVRDRSDESAHTQGTGSELLAQHTSRHTGAMAGAMTAHGPVYS